SGLFGFCNATVRAAGLASPAAQPHILLITTKVVSLLSKLFMKVSTASVVVSSSKLYLVKSLLYASTSSFIYSSYAFMTYPSFPFVSKHFQVLLLRLQFEKLRVLFGVYIHKMNLLYIYTSTVDLIRLQLHI